MIIVGISAYYHDSAISIIKDGTLLFAAHEERYSRIKHDSRFPILALKAGLRETGINVGDIDAVIYYENPLLKFRRLVKSAITTFPRGIYYYIGAFKDWKRNQKLFIKSKIKKILQEEFRLQKPIQVLYGKHHQSHAAAAFYPSGYSEAAILCIDGVGEFDTCTIWKAKNNRLELKKSINFPSSVGLLYSSFTYYCGFKVNSGEYKLMGLAPYGEPNYYEKIVKHLFKGSHRKFRQLDMKYFSYHRNHIMINENFIKLFDNHGARKQEAEITEHYLDVAASIQKVIEEIVIGLAKEAKEITGSNNLCMSGGVALNCVANGKLYSKRLFENIWVQPASGDAGSALGCALDYYNKQGYSETTQKTEFDPFIGSSYSNKEIIETLSGCNATYVVHEDESELNQIVAREIASGLIIGWHQGRSEFGPRALGGRSILGDARNEDSQKRINLKIKKREGFRPFAPIVLREDAYEYFEINETDSSPYMLFVYKIKEEMRKRVDKMQRSRLIDRVNQCRSTIPAVTHVDYSARVQTVEENMNKKLYKLLEEFKKQTGCG